MAGLLGAMIAGGVEGGADQVMKAEEEEIKAFRATNLERLKQKNRFAVVDYAAESKAKVTAETKENYINPKTGDLGFFAPGEVPAGYVKDSASVASRANTKYRVDNAKLTGAAAKKSDTAAKKRALDFQNKLFENKKAGKDDWYKKKKPISDVEMSDLNAIRAGAELSALTFEESTYDALGPDKGKTPMYRLVEVKTGAQTQDVTPKVAPKAAVKEVTSTDTVAAEKAVSTANITNVGELREAANKLSKGKTAAQKEAILRALRKQHPDLVKLLTGKGASVTKKMPGVTLDSANKAFSL